MSIKVTIFDDEVMKFLYFNLSQLVKSLTVNCDFRTAKFLETASADI